MNTEHKIRNLQTSLAVCSLISVLIFVGCWTSLGQDIETGDDDLRLQIWDSEFPIVFEEKDLGVDIERDIVKDLQSLYRRPIHWLYRSHRPNAFTINNKPMPILGNFRPYGGLRIRLPSFYVNFGTLVSLDGTENISIPTALSDFYQQAFARRTENGTAYTKLKTFVDYLNNVEDRDFPGWNNVYYFHGGKKKHSKETLGEPNVHVFQERYKPYTCRIMSILHVQKGIHPQYIQGLDLLKIDTPFEYDNSKSKLTARAYFFDKKGRGRFFNHLIYDGARWKIWFNSNRYPIRGMIEEVERSPNLADFRQNPLNLKILDANYPLLFEDTALSKKRKDAIVADLQSLLGQPKHRMLYGKLKPYYETWRKSWNDGFRLVVVENVEYFLVQKILSDAYEKSFTAMEGNPKALTHLRSFIDYMNHIKEREWVGFGNLGYPCFYNSSDRKHWNEYKNMGKKEFLREWHEKGKVRHLVCPSALAVSMPSDHFKENEMPIFEDGPPKLVASIYFTDDKDRFEEEWMLVYHKNRWKVLLPFGGE